MKNLVRTFALPAVLAAVFCLTSAALAQGGDSKDLEQAVFGAEKISGPLKAEVAGKIRSGRAGDAVPVIIRMSGRRPDVSALNRIVKSGFTQEERAEWRAGVVRELEKEATLRHDSVRNLVAALDGAAKPSFWLVNAFAAALPAQRVAELAGHPDVVALELDGYGAPDQDNRVGCNPSGPGFPAPPPWPAGVWQTGIYSHGAESVIQQGAAHDAGYDGSEASGSFLPARVPLAIADSGFDMETDQWRGNNPPGTVCWCPDQTLTVSPSCTGNLGGPTHHGEFTAYFRNLALGYFHITRVAGDLDFVTGDGFNSSEAIYWGAPFNFPGFGITGQNFLGYAHGTQMAALAAGAIYSDWQGDTTAGCVICPPGFDCGGPFTFCPVIGMDGVARAAELYFYKIADDSQGSFSPFSAQIAALQQAMVDGVRAYNQSYESDNYPLSAVAEAFDRAANEGNIVIVGSAGNLGTSVPDPIRKGYFNGLIVAATRFDTGFVDQVAAGSSRGLLAWFDPNNQLVVSGRDGNNVAAPGGNFTTTATFQGLNSPFPDEAYSQSTYFGSFAGGLWGQSFVGGTSPASALVAGGAALVLGADLKDNGVYNLNQLQVRAILLNQADDISAANPGEGPEAYGQGRLNVFAAADFTTRGGRTIKGKVWPGSSKRDYQVSWNAGQPTELTLVWDRVVYPVVAQDTRASNLGLEVYKGTPGCSGMTCTPRMTLPVAQSKHPENNYERITFTPSTSGTYTIRVKVPSGGFVLSDGSDGNPAGTTPKVPFAIAHIQN